MSVYTLYGTFWMSYAMILIPGTGIIAAFGTNTREFDVAIGMYLSVWSMVTYMFT